jgi:dipeptidyl aminopeptidase/acylaminoacyl peptidase
MNRQRLSAVLVLVAAFVAFAPVGAEIAAKRPLDLEDILAYKAMSQTVLAPSGQWFAYRMAPAQGDSDVIVRNTSTDREMRFPVGETPSGGAGAAGTMAFSSDSSWIAMTTSPTRQEALAAQRTRRPLHNGVTLVNLTTGDKVSVPKIRRFAFSGEKSGWIALHRYGPDAAGGAGASGAAAGSGRGGRGGGAATSSDAPRDTSPKGTDLVLHDLASGLEINVGNVSEFAFDKSGRYLALLIDAADQAGNGIQIRDMSSGTVTPLETDKAFYERLSWTPDGDALAALKGRDDRAWRDRLYAVIGFSGFSSGAPKKAFYDPAKDASFPANMSISGNRAPQWTEGRDAITFGIADIRRVQRPAGGRGGAGADDAATGDTAAPPSGSAAQNDDTPDRPNLVIWHYKDPRLQSQQQVQESRDRQFSYASLYRVAENKFVRLADDTLRDVTPGDKGTWAIGNDVSAYELEGNLDGRQFRDVYAVNMQTGDRKVLQKRVRWGYTPSPDGTKWFFYENRQFHVDDLTTGETHAIATSAPISFVDAEDDHNVVDPPIAPMGWTSDSANVLLSDGWDVWKVPVAAGAPAVSLTGNGKKDSLRYRRVRTDPDEKGADLSKPQYFSAVADWTKKAGYGVLEPGQTGVKMLTWDDAAFSRLQKAEKSEIWIYSRETSTQAGDVYVTNASLANGRKITNLGTETEPFLWTSGAQLLDYKNDKGEHLQGAFYLPANYEKGKQYPMVVEIYERESQGLNQYGRPAANGFSRQAYTSNGYAVLMPDIKYYVNDPGMSAVWALVPAVKAAIATGVVDPKRVGLHGHSWGGYQTAFTITQTDIFAAAVAGAPLTDMISMYSLIYKNSGGTNGAIFESSQGRFTGGPWEQWAAYTRNSPVASAKNVKTPLMILHNDADGAVDFTQGIEYYDTLRRLGKPVVLLEYPGENHGLARPANQQDYTVRMKEFFDHHLKGAPAPEWLENGVPRLKMQEHIDERLKERQDKQKAAAPAGQRGGGGGR